MPEPQSTPWNLGILLSGAGRTLENLFDVIGRGELDAGVSVVISSVPDVRGLDVAAAAGVPHFVIRRGDYGSLRSYSAAMYEQLIAHSVDLIVMAGYLRKMSIFRGWEGRILNIHPCLLPDAGRYAAETAAEPHRASPATPAQPKGSCGALSRSSGSALPASTGATVRPPARS